MGQRGGRKKEPKKRGKKLIAAFCSAINDDEGLEGRETFRWLREDVLRCPLSPPLVTPHPLLSPSVRSAYSQFLRRSSPSSRSHSTITTATRATTTIDPQTASKAKIYSGHLESA